MWLPLGMSLMQQIQALYIFVILKFKLFSYNIFSLIIKKYTFFFNKNYLFSIPNEKYREKKTAFIEKQKLTISEMIQCVMTFKLIVLF